jgi:threonine/homoserine/homoserine lactone efflux protein
MILAIILGFITGWAISMPIGPVNAASITRTIRFGPWHGFAVGTGAAKMDIIYCGGATQINEYLLSAPVLNLFFRIIGFGLLIFLGIKSLRVKPQEHPMTSQEDMKSEATAEHRVEKLHLAQGNIIASLALGIVLYASNIASLPEWIFITAFWKHQGLLSDGFTISLIFAAAAGLGTAGWFFTLTRYFAKKQTTLKPKTLAIINKVAGFAMLGFGIYFGYMILFNTDWARVNKALRRAEPKEVYMITNSISRRA